MDKMDIQEKLVAILARHTSIERSAFTPDKDLKLDLGLDSLDVAEIVYEFVHEKMAEPAENGMPVPER